MTHTNMTPSTNESFVMQGTLSPPSTLLPIQILLTTETGRHLYHYVHPNPANYSQTNMLSAAFAAFTASTANKVSTIITPLLTIVAVTKSPLLLAIASQTPSHPTKHLEALARQTLTTVFTSLSASFIHYLSNFPTSDTSSIVSRFEPLLNRVIMSALSCPLSPTLSLLPSLPAPLHPASHTNLNNTICRALSSFKHVSNVLVLTASPPYPRRIIACASRANSRLSSLDLLILLQVPPERIEERSQSPDVLFLPTCGFHKGFRSALRAVELDTDSLNTTTNAHSIINNQPIGVVGANSLWLMALGDWKYGEQDGERYLDQLRNSLDESTVGKDILVAMARPWNIFDIHRTGYSTNVRAVLMLGSERFVGTTNGFRYDVSEAVLHALELHSGSHISHSVKGMLVLICERKYVVIFDADVSEEDSWYVMEQVFVPWMKRFEASLLPIDERIIVQPSTPLAGFLAPFSS